jgi:outer membrane protein
MKRFLAFAVFFIAAAAGAEPVAFEDLPRLIEDRNLHAQSARKFLEAAQTRQGHLARSFLPTVHAEAGSERFKTGTLEAKSQPSGAVEARINLFNGGKDRLQEKIRAEEARLAAVQHKRATVDELTRARRAYWTLASQREMIGLLQEARERNDVHVAAAAKRIRAGLATETDRLEFDMHRVQLQQDTMRLTWETANAERQLRILLGFPEGTRLEVSSQVPHSHDEALLDVAPDLQAHRDLQALNASRRMGLHQKAQARRWWTPSLDAYAGYALYTLRDRDYLDREDRDDAAAGFRLSLDLFDGLRSRAAGSASALEAAGYEAQARQTVEELKADLQSAQQALKMLHALIHDADASVEEGQKYLAQTLNEYARGVKNSPDVLAASEKHMELQRRSIELRRDYHLAKTELLAVLGQ